VFEDEWDRSVARALSAEEMLKSVLALSRPRDDRRSGAAVRRLAEALATPYGVWIHEYLKEIGNTVEFELGAHGSVIALRVPKAPSRPFAFLRSTDGKVTLRLRWVEVLALEGYTSVERLGGRRKYQVLCNVVTRAGMLDAVHLTHVAIRELDTAS
jgi:hypothetical protein